MFTDYWKDLVLNFPEMGNTIFFEPKNDGKMIFTNYWKFLVLNFPNMGNTVFFEPKIWWKKDIYWLLESSCFEPWKVLVLNFSELGNTGFFWAKKLRERWCLLGLFELPKIFQDLGNTFFCAASFQVQPITNYFRANLVFIWNNAPREMFNFYFSRGFC